MNHLTMSTIPGKLKCGVLTGRDGETIYISSSPLETDGANMLHVAIISYIYLLLTSWLRNEDQITSGDPRFTWDLLATSVAHLMCYPVFWYCLAEQFSPKNPPVVSYAKNL